MKNYVPYWGIICILSISASATRVQWKVENGGNDHWYEVVCVADIGWLDALNAAYEKGGYLATITSAEENNFIFDLTLQTPCIWINKSGWMVGPRIGGTDAGSEGTWRWITGEEWEYESWLSGQPDNWQGIENYLIFWGSGERTPTWNDSFETSPGNDSFETSTGYVVETEPNRVGAMSPTPADNAEDVSKNTILSWVPNEEAQSHDVYLDTDRNAVINATTSSPEFQGSVTEPSFGPVSLKGETTYFWRVNSILPSETYKGDIWSFTTLPTCYHTLKGDLNQDCTVNILDLALLSEEWMRSEPSLIARFTLDTNPNWLTQGQWQYGVPTGGGGTEFGNPDPTAGYTGNNVYGVNLSGDYDLMVGDTYALTTGLISCADFPVVTLKFARWLNTDAPEYVLCKVEASQDNTTWQTVWSNPSAIEDNSWTLIEYDLSNVAGSQSSVFIRWTYEVKSARALPYSGWNIDDVELLGQRLP